jgi:G3E family GTPase/SHS2 domain-containing protein
MKARTPLTVITGPLGGGKTTLLRHVLGLTRRKLAILMNEFGEIAIDSKIIEGKSVRLAELAGGCVCCSLVGEFEAAVNEIIDTVAPEHIVLETTGVAEPGALVVDIQENLPQVRLDGVVSVIDADGLLQFPALGHTARMQIEEADLLLLNKIDLVPESDLGVLEGRLRAVNPTAPVLRAQRCAVDLDLLFGIARQREIARPRHIHQPEYESFAYTTDARFDRRTFEEFAASLPPEVYRAKGFVRLAEGCHLFNFVNGRWDFEPFESERTELVFIGRRDALSSKGAEGTGEREKLMNNILARLKAAEQAARSYEFLAEVALADIAFRARGADLSAVFIASAEATMNAMIDNLDAIEPREERRFTLENDALDLLLFDFLNEVIFYKDSEQLLLRIREVRIEESQRRWTLRAEARGEKLDPTRHHQRVDVKAVTLHQFKLEQTAAGWEAMVILDI